MIRIIKKAEKLRKRHDSDDLGFLALKLKARLFEMRLGKIVKEVYFKDLKAIVIDPNLHPYQKKTLYLSCLRAPSFSPK